MSKLSLPRPFQISTNPQVNSDALAWANLMEDQIERWANGSFNLGNHAVNFGSLTLTFTAAATSATVTTAHGLGATPRIWTQPADFGALATGPLVYIGNIGNTNFDCKGQDAGGVVRTGTVIVYWLAIV